MRAPNYSWKFFYHSLSCFRHQFRKWDFPRVHLNDPHCAHDFVHDPDPTICLPSHFQTELSE
jgi:hypothetical protein